MARILRGGVHWADLSPTAGQGRTGRRPVLVIGQEVNNARSGTVIVLATASRAEWAGFPLTLEPGGRQLPEGTRVRTRRIATLSVECAGRKLRAAMAEELPRLLKD